MVYGARVDSGVPHDTLAFVLGPWNTQAQIKKRRGFAYALLYAALPRIAAPVTISLARTVAADQQHQRTVGARQQRQHVFKQGVRVCIQQCCCAALQRIAASVTISLARTLAANQQHQRTVGARQQRQHVFKQGVRVCIGRLTVKLGA